MKLLILTAATVTQFSIAAPIFCKGQLPNQSIMSLSVSNHHRDASIFVNRKEVPFGELACATSKQSSSYLHCRSKQVSQARFIVTIGPLRDGQISQAKVNQVSYSEYKTIATLRCVQVSPN